ncbi:exodeoxyribonuclease VII large subunit [Endozoicomonas sp. Mp262]
MSELNSQARRLLEISFHNIRVEGEISSLARPSSGHWYFTLKDERAQIRCAMFRNRNQSLRFVPSEGMLVQIRGRVSLYENRGDYQLIIDHMEEAGNGALQKAFEQLKKKLAQEGLFDSERKRKLPAYPKHIGVITSPTGAAIRDILSVLERRAPFIPVTVIPSPVQGNEATGQLIQALNTASKADFDVIILSRGGGSLEDLWPFNEEALARAIAKHPVPVVSAVGHEIDFTIADFVADYRAPTPSAAAEILSPDRKTLLERVNLLNRKLTTMTLHKLQMAQHQLHSISKRLRHPGDQLREHSQRLDDLEIRMQQALCLQLERKKADLQRHHNKLVQLSPVAKLGQIKLQTTHFEETLHNQISRKLETQQQKLQNLSGQLHLVSPLSTMARGYSITQKQGQIISRANQLQLGNQITLRLHKGSADCTVDQIHE